MTGYPSKKAAAQGKLQEQLDKVIVARDKANEDWDEAIVARVKANADRFKADAEIKRIKALMEQRNG